MVRQLLVCAAVGLVALTAQGAILNFDATGIGNAASMPVSMEAPGIGVSPMVRGSGLGASQGHSVNAFGSSLKGDVTTTLTEAVNDNCHFSFTVTPEAGYSVSFDALSFYLFVPERVSSGTVFWNPIVTFYSSATGFAEGDFLGQLDIDGTPENSRTFGPRSFDLSGVAALQGVSSEVEFRLVYHSKYDKGETVANRPNFWENVGLGGDAGADTALYVDGTVVPEPASLALLAVGGLATLLRRRR